MWQYECSRMPHIHCRLAWWISTPGGLWRSTFVECSGLGCHGFGDWSFGGLSAARLNCSLCALNSFEANFHQFPHIFPDLVRTFMAPSAFSFATPSWWVSMSWWSNSSFTIAVDQRRKRNRRSLWGNGYKCCWNLSHCGCWPTSWSMEYWWLSLRISWMPLISKISKLTAQIFGTFKPNHEIRWDKHKWPLSTSQVFIVQDFDHAPKVILGAATAVAGLKLWIDHQEEIPIGAQATT